jgi:CheY-like chemotaxis protein
MFRQSHPIPPLNDGPSLDVYPFTIAGEKKLREAQSAGRGKRRPKTDSGLVRKPNSMRAGQCATVIVVDDDPSVLRALTRLLRAAGFKVLPFDRPSALLASPVPLANACLLVDINLPEMNGSELCSAMAESGRGLPAILITGRNDSATQRLIAEANAVEALFKPVDERALFDAIARALASGAEPK